jgi:DNA-binding response OmpR family regulator
MSNLTIMVVDDEEDIRETLAYYLKSQGFNVLTCYDGLDAWETLCVSKPDLVLLDLSMPRMSGEDFLLKCRKKEEFRQLPIIVISAVADTLKDKSVLGAVRKPFSLKQIQELIKTHFPTSAS